MRKAKGFYVANEVMDRCTLVLAETRGKAKSSAQMLLDCGYLELVCWRYPWIDGLAGKFSQGPLRPDSLTTQRIYRDCGFAQVLDGNLSRHCPSCGKSEWFFVPESKILPSGICRECTDEADNLSKLMEEEL